MTEREKLADLILNAPKLNFPAGSRAQGKTYQTALNMADHLLANGVIVPKVKAGQTVWFPSEYHEGAYPITITHLEIYEEEIILYSKGGGEWLDTDIGKTLFLTREEAEAALKERSES